MKSILEMTTTELPRLLTDAEVAGIVANVDEYGYCDDLHPWHVRSLAFTLRAVEEKLRQVREFASAHHSDEDPARWLHALTVDIPAILESAPPPPGQEEP